MTLQPTDPSLFYSRQDPEDPRIGEFVSATIPQDHDSCIHVFGWPDDEGIRLNGGRPGAAQAPDRIRRYLYRMTPSLSVAPKSPRLIDRGNLAITGTLSERHEAGRRLVAEALKKRARTLSFGGGHDFGFADGAGFLDAFASLPERPLVVNFDAHLDVRPSQIGPHSGTPFRRLLEAFPRAFDFIEIGLQPQCNSRAHADWARAQGAELWMADDVNSASAMAERISRLATAQRRRPLWVSLDIDALAIESAPGCSQSWAGGLSYSAVRSALLELAKITDWRALSIYEVSPPLDVDDRTSKLASLFAHQFLFSFGAPGGS